MLFQNTQSWSIIAGAGTHEHTTPAMDSVKEQPDTGMGLMINDPSPPDSMVNGSPEGYSENGGIFCQANCRAIMAEALLGRGGLDGRGFHTIFPRYSSRT